MREILRYWQLPAGNLAIERIRDLLVCTLQQRLAVSMTDIPPAP